MIKTNHQQKPIKGIMQANTKTALKPVLKKNGQSIRWFYDNYISGKIELTYGGMCHQLNGYAPLSEEVQEKIEQYIES